MRADSNQPHYAPSSVGALMDPAFLRSARYDADGGSHGVSPPPAAGWVRLQTAMRQVVAACRRGPGRA